MLETCSSFSGLFGICLSFTYQTYWLFVFRLQHVARVSMVQTAVPVLVDTRVPAPDMVRSESTSTLSNFKLPLIIKGMTLKKIDFNCLKFSIYFNFKDVKVENPSMCNCKGKLEHPLHHVCINVLLSCYLIHFTQFGPVNLREP